jgi:hypothetical protein
VSVGARRITAAGAPAKSLPLAPSRLASLGQIEDRPHRAVRSFAKVETSEKVAAALLPARSPTSGRSHMTLFKSTGKLTARISRASLDFQSLSSIFV